MLLIFGRVFGIFSLILVGYITYRLGVFGKDAKDSLTKLLLYITAPCMAAYSIYSKDLSSRLIESTVQVLIVNSLYYAVGVLVAYLIVKYFKFEPRQQWGVYIAAMIATNNGFMGFPVTQAIFGDDIFYLLVMINIPTCIFFYGIMPMVLNIGRNREKSSLKSNLKSMINPAMIGITVGVLFMLMQFRPPEAINSMVKYLSDATIPISMIIVGVQLGDSNLKEIIKDKYVNLTSIVRMFIIPVITFLSVHFLPMLNDEVKLITVFSSIFPTAVVTAAISVQQKIEGNKAAEIVSITTVISLATIPLFAAILTYFYL